MAKFDGVKGQAVMTVDISDNEITFIFGDNRFLFITAVESGLEVTILPE